MPKESNEIMIVDKNILKDKIYEIRGQKVMLDSDLADIYGYDTRDFNKQVTNNIERFDSDFIFRITKSEWKEILRWKISTAKSLSSKRRYMPYVFTEQGIYMLMTVLKGELAIKQSKALIKLFKSMKEYIFENNYLLTNTYSYIESRFAEHDKRFESIENKLEIVMDNFIDPSKYKHFLIMNGERIESDIAYKQIYSFAKHSLIIVDDYINIKTLSLLKTVSKDVIMTIISDNKSKDKVDDIMLIDFALDTGLQIELKPNNGLFHDRYIFIDINYDSEMIYHCGHSSKDSGNKIATITEINDLKLYKEKLGDLINEWIKTKKKRIRFNSSRSR